MIITQPSKFDASSAEIVYCPVINALASNGIVIVFVIIPISLIEKTLFPILVEIEVSLLFDTPK